MKSLFRFVARNLKRNVYRTILAATSVAIASLLVVILLGLVNGMVENMIRNSTKNETGHVRVVSKEYLKEISIFPVNYVVHQPEEIINYLLSYLKLSKRFQIITERIKFPVLLQVKGNNKTAFCIAGDINKEKQLLMLDKSIVEGKYLTGEKILLDGEKHYEIIIGKKLAEILELKVGDTFSVLLQGVDLGLHIPSFYVKGIFQTGLNTLDENVFMINVEDAKKILKTDGAVHEIFIMLKNYKEAQKVAYNNYPKTRITII